MFGDNNRKKRYMVQGMYILLLVMAAVFLGLIDGSNKNAEAILGGFGNITASDNPHNFSYGSAAGSVKTSDSQESRVCIFCHTPHFADRTTSGLINAPLWNHALSTTASYSVKSPGVYTDPSLLGTVNLVSSPLNPPDGVSKLCLGCHDGSVAIGNVRTIVGGIPIDTSHACIDTDGTLLETANCSITSPGTGRNINLENRLDLKHVVSVPMNSSLLTAHNANCSTATGQTTMLTYPWNDADPPNTNPLPTTVFLRPTFATYSGSNGILGSTVQSATGCSSSAQCTKNYGSTYYYGVQCSTCHDPHYWANVASSATAGYKFLVTDFNSLCQSCHYVPTTPCP